MTATSNRKPLMAGNWKMNHTHLEAIQVVQKLSYRLDDKDYDAGRRADLPGIHRPAIACRRPSTATGSRSPSARRTCTGRSSGAFTGEVSAPMLAKLNVSLRDRRPLGAAGDVRRHRRGRRARSCGRCSRRACGRSSAAARRSRSATPGRPTHGSTARCAPRFSGAEGGRCAALRGGLRAHLGDRHRAQCDARRRRCHDRCRARHDQEHLPGGGGDDPRSSTGAASSRATPPS